MNIRELKIELDKYPDDMEVGVVSSQGYEDFGYTSSLVLNPLYVIPESRPCCCWEYDLAPYASNTIETLLVIS